MKRCLIVDDSDVVRKVAGTILAVMGYEIVEASNGRDAYELFKTTYPDAMLIDWLIPETPAHDLIVKVRAHTSGRRPHIVYLTTEYDHADVARAFAEGADACLMKPFDRISLEDRFRKRAAA